MNDAKTDVEGTKNPNGTTSVPVNTLKNGKLGAKTVDISWNPSQAGLSRDGKVTSPAMVLLHEAIHGDHAIGDIQSYNKNLNDVKSMGDYDNREEFNTIQEANTIAKSFPFENSNRGDHRGSFVPVLGGVTSNLIVPQDPPALIDKTKNVVLANH